jgi:putative MATE family efflux protein
MQNGNNLTEGKISSVLIRFSIPYLLANLIQTAYSSVDVFFLGHFGSSASQAGAFSSLNLIYTMLGIFLGLTAGGTILLGQYAGAKLNRDAAKATGNIIIVFVAACALGSGLILTFGKLFIGITNVPPEATGEAWAYLRTCAIGIVFIMGYNCVSSVLRGLGNSKAPLVFVAISCSVNILLDYIFIAPLGMGAYGAALATVIAQGLSFLLSLAYLAVTKLPFEFSLRDIRPDAKKLALILKLGIPISLQTLLNMISFVIIGAIINKMGVFASAASGVVNNLINFYMVIPLSLGSALSAITAQNIGAGTPRRALRSTKIGIVLSLIIAVPVVVVACFFPEACVSLLTNDPDVIRASAAFLIPFSWDCIFVSFVFCLNGFFNGCGRTAFAATHETIAALLIRAPLSLVLSLIPGATLFHIGIGTPAATAASFIMCAVYYRLKLSGEKLDKLTIVG